MRVAVCFALLISTVLAFPQAAELNLEAENRFLEEENRFLLNEAEPAKDDESRAGISYATAGDFTLISVPWSKSTTLGYNGTAAETISTLGNIGLIIGGLYILAGFKGAASNLARSDPLGLSRRFVRPEMAAPPPPSFHKFNHKIGEGLPAKAPMKKPTNKPAKKQSLPTKAFSSNADDRQQVNRPRPGVGFRVPTVPNLRLRRPNFPALRNPFRARPAALQARPTQAPLRIRPTTAVRTVPVVSARPTRPVVPENASTFRNQGNTILPEPVSFNSPFDQDPFSEFRDADFGNSGSFRELLDDQFGDFTFEKVRRKAGA